MNNVIIKYLEGISTEIEQQDLLNWMRNKENRKIFYNNKLDWKESLDKNKLPVGSEKAWEEIQIQLLQKSIIKLQKSMKIKRFLRIAAIFLSVISITSLVYNFSSWRNSIPEYSTSVIAENGQISKIEMPDGSTVWLNSGSTITYNNKFASKNRDVKLIGEAYFNVTNNENLPLVVNCGELRVKVLGTKFNVSTYPNSEFVNVVLEKGSVELLNSKVEPFSYLILPGELAKFDMANRNLDVIKVRTSKYTSWKQGIINIYNQSLEELIGRLEFHYNQNFEIDDAVKDLHYTFTIRNESMDQILKLMKKISPIKVIQKNDVILIKLDEHKKNIIDSKI